MYKKFINQGHLCPKKNKLNLKKIFNIMRISILLLSVGILSLSASVYSQDATISIQMRDISVSDVFSAIKEQTNYSFWFDVKDVDVERRVSLDANNETVKSVLTQTLEDQDVYFALFGNHIIISKEDPYHTMAILQNITITGIVTDANGESLPGVTIMIKGTTQGTATDANGAYSLQVPNENAILLFSFIGFTTQEITVGNRKTINTILVDDTRVLEEVVVIGYGSVQKKDLTGSVGSISSEDIVLKGTTSVMGAMQGTVPGVNISQDASRIGGGYSIQIRGQNSLSGGTPLYVVDGVIVGDIDFLNPSDIERIDILKDASSTAIYGSQGSNGVVLVQTKNADFGLKSRLTVSYDGYWGYRQIARVPDFMNGREWIDFQKQAVYTWNAPSEKWELLNMGMASIITKRLYEEDYTDWFDLITQNGHQQNHYANISGNTRDISYNVGFGYQNEEGNFIYEKSDRYNMKVSVNHRPSKYFQSGATANLSFANIDAGSQSGYSASMMMMQFLKAYDENGNLYDQPGAATALMGETSFTGSSNPLIEIKSGNQETRRYDIIANIFAQVTPIEGLNIKTTFSPRLNHTRLGRYRGVVVGNRSVDYGSSNNQENFNYIWDNQISYAKTFKNHRLDATLINSVYKTRYEQLSVVAQDFPFKPYWYNLYSGTVVLGDGRSAYTETSMLSYAGRVNYDYRNKYLATVTLRYDGSSKLAQKWNAFPSFALAWRMSEEEFLKTPWLSNLKARFSFGYSGNNNGVSAYGTQLKPNTGSNVLYDYDGIRVSGFSPGTPVNQNLAWEKTREYNLGFDFGFIKNRINGSIDIYDKLSDGLLMSRRLAIESGVTSMIDNIGSVNNRGFELSLNTVNINKKDFYWTTSLTFAMNKNAIRTLYGRKEDVIGEDRFIGKPINVIYDYKILGIWTQAEYDAGLSEYYRPDGTLQYKAKPGEAKTLDANGDGMLSTDDRVILGYPDPKWTGSFNSTLQFRNFDFSFVIYSKQGVFSRDAFIPRFGYSTSRGTQKVKFDFYIPVDIPVVDWENFLVNENGQYELQFKSSGAGHENSKYPIYNNAGGSYYGSNNSYQDASFVKVKNIILGYSFDKKLIQKVGMSQLRVYVNVLNPFVFTKYVGWDPEYAATDLDSGNGPSTIVYQAGVNIKF